MTNRWQFRDIQPGDEPFLERLYASTRADELSIVPWSDDQKQAFLQMQFRAQHQHYQQHYSSASFQIIICGGEPIGRLYVDRRSDEIRIVDIALLPEHRRQGIGGAIMRQLMDEAKGTGRPVRIHVERNNPAMQLYQRLGFRTIDDVGIYYLMEWCVDSGQHR